ncbi:peroxidase [Sphingosinicellaceae bacterium]|nr:peroxidase [Sphingosinicellaceae bacterium]
MAIPSEMLDRPIDWRDPQLATLLARLQGNILKGHGRDQTLNLFLRFDSQQVAKVRIALKELGGHVTSALSQLEATEKFKSLGIGGATPVFIMISAAGYRALGVADTEIPADPQFRAGMKAQAAILHDPSPQSWEPKFAEEIHGLVVIADDSVTAVANAAAKIETRLTTAGIHVVGRDAGHALRRVDKGPGIEHFGYVDGRSQPLMLADDVAAERVSGGIGQWDPAFGPGRIALVADPASRAEDAYGSYLVYRKLEQDVRGFKRQEQQLAATLGLVGVDEERAGAMVVGRFEDGTPLAVQKSDTGVPPAANDFNYAGDLDGLKCPFQAHIRKVNPRGGTVDEFGAVEAQERAHLMPRRGIPFGERADDLDTISSLPRRGVGLLFMAYNQDISRQFEFTQSRWANEPDFIRADTGIDPIIGQLSPGETAVQQWRAHYGAPASAQVDADFHGFVTMRGGEYFFAPSLTFFAEL